MKRCVEVLVQVAALLIFYFTAAAYPNAGFCLPDSVSEMQLKFRNVRDLIVVPVMINNTVEVNLILDTGCRSLVLFGKKFEKMLNVTDQEVSFSGLGAGQPVMGHLSLNNHVSIKSIEGKNVALVVVPDRNLFSAYADVHGVIGYDIFIKFEIEINSRAHLLKFRPASSASPPYGYARIPLEIVDSKPVMESQLLFGKSLNQQWPLMIDTGSTLGLLLKTSDLSPFSSFCQETVVGRGFNGLLKGYRTKLKKMILKGLQLQGVAIGVVESTRTNQASIGMNILKDYVVILNYCQSYACFKAVA
jgi:hypothetical protein